MSTNVNNDGNDNINSENARDGWWFSPVAYAIKFGILLGLFVVFTLYFLGGYLHAQRRLKKGLPPLRYHRWMLPRHQRAQFGPQQQFSFYQVQDGYAMQGYPPPPPAYNPNAPLPPTYQPPERGSKVAPSQNVYEAPVGPPPSSSAQPAVPEAAQQASSNHFFGRFKR